MKKRILALMMALVMVFGLNTTVLASGSATVDNEVEIPTEVDITIDENWDIVVKQGAGEYSVYYYFEIYKDGGFIAAFGHGSYASESEVRRDMGRYLNGSGEYHVEVIAHYEYDGAETIIVEGATDKVSYTQPDKELAVPSNIKMDEAGVLTFDTVEGASEYCVTFTYDYLDSAHTVSSDIYITADGSTCTFDIAYDVGHMIMDVDVYVTVKAISSNVNEMFHSQASEFAGPYEHRPEVNDVKIEWDAENPGVINFEKVAGNDYYITVYKDDIFVGSTFVSATDTGEVTADFSHSLRDYGAGEYIARLEATVWDAENAEYVYYTGESTLNYAPAAKLEAPANVAVSDDYVVTFDWVDDADSYQIFVREEYLGTGDVFEWADAYVSKEDGQEQGSCDMSWLEDQIARLKEQGDDVVLKLGVRALSDDIKTVGTSDAAWVTVYEQKSTADEVKDELEKLLADENTTPGELRNVLVMTSNDVLVELMKDTSFVTTIAGIENDYVMENIINQLAPVSTVEAVDASKVTVVGAALNAEIADDVQLTIDTPETTATVPEGYTNAVALDIKLMIDGVSMKDLSVPVTITMPIPTGVSTEDLVIFHYHEEGKDPVVITPVVNADGTMTFTVTGFSTFVVASNDTTTPGGGDTEDGTDTPDGGTDTPEGDTDTPDGGTDTPEGDTNTPGTGTTPGTTPGTGTTPATPAPGSGNSPKTGDVAGVATVCAIMVFAAAAVVVIRKRANVK